MNKQKGRILYSDNLIDLDLLPSWCREIVSDNPQRWGEFVTIEPRGKHLEKV